MFYRWNTCPALALPPTAFAILTPGGGWVRVSAGRVVGEGERLTAPQFTAAFGADLPPFPEPFREAGQAWGPEENAPLRGKHRR